AEHDEAQEAGQPRTPRWHPGVDVAARATRYDGRPGQEREKKPQRRCRQLHYFSSRSAAFRPPVLSRDARGRDGSLEGNFFGAVGTDAPSQLELLVAPWAEFTELGFAMRAEDVLRVDGFAAAGTGSQLARRPTWLRQCLGL